jgi:Common central domain of tyrosinase/Polyphenol oxidase middle domain
MRTDLQDVGTRAVTPYRMVNRAAFLWGGNAMFNLRLFCAAITVLVAALAVQVAEAQPRGTADIVWQHVGGQVHYWPMQGGQRTGGVHVFTPVSGDWALRGVGDVDGDGTADIVWQHVSGQVHYWPMQGGQRTGGVHVFTPVSGDWALRGVGDVDGLGQRKSVNALTASELMSLRRGVAQMMARNNASRDSVDFRRSWVYWANMHAHFGADCGGPMTGSGMAGVQTFTASNASETATWCACEHGNDRFLTWHRMYLWYFERVLQAAAGNPSLRLPYWDYATNPTLPAAYRDPTYVNEAGQTVPNPLRVEARQPGLNAGSAGLSPGVRTASGAMTATSFGLFRSALEQTPHGAVHCALVVGGCPNGLMGAVPASALDPIFYAHHTNIDRLYECWLRVNEAARLPSDPAHLNTQYTFVDADGSTPQRRVSDMLRLSQLGYAYAEGADCPAVAAVAVAAGGANVSDANPAAAAGEQPIELAGPTRLELGVTTVRLNVPPTARERLSARAAPSAGRRVYVVIEGLTFDVAPGTLYNVYLAGDGGRREQIGAINFFNFTVPRAGAHAGHDSSAGRYTFDATDAVQRLSLDTAAQPSLVFEPTTGLTDSSPEAAAALISPQANVRFDSVRLVTAP